MKPFVHLHVHTEFSLLDGAARIKKMVKLCKEYNMPIIYFSFDSETSDTGIKTRLEAFYDMLCQRKKE